jgi:hypothetical protein
MLKTLVRTRLVNHTTDRAGATLIYDYRVSLTRMTFPGKGPQYL